MEKIEIRTDGSQRVQYDFNDFYACARKYFLSAFQNYTGDSHWHDDLEFICIISGSMQYNVNGKISSLNEGDGIFVNARQLHFAFSETKTECEFLCILLHPMLLCSTQFVENDLVSPIISSLQYPFLLLNKESFWHRKILEAIKDIYEKKNLPNACLYIQKDFYDIWIKLTENLSVKATAAEKTDYRLSILKNMLSFIGKNYSESISLEQIAKSGNVSKSTCLSIFKKYLQDTPTNHLIGYRLNKSAELILASDLSIAEIAMTVGFQSVSYYSKAFKENYGCTPREYKNTHSNYNVCC